MLNSHCWLWTKGWLLLKINLKHSHSHHFTVPQFLILQCYKYMAQFTQIELTISRTSTLNSKQEWKTKLKQICITQLSINNEDLNLESLAAQFLSEQLNMDRLYTDANVVINKYSVYYTLLFYLSDVRFKKSI